MEQPMSRVVPAARQLIAEVEDVGGSVTIIEDRDGLGFLRSVRLTNATAKRLGDDVLDALETDRRVAEVVKSSKGVRVTFVSSVAADSAEPFGLASVL
jgi:hypothetical protein